MNEININISQDKVNEYFTNLNIEEKNLLINLHHNLLISLQNQYHITHFTNNDYIDCLFILIPYINTEKINELKNIKELNEIYIKKEKEYNINTNQYKDYDISNILNQIPPKYTFSNIEFNICNENDKNNLETNFNINHLINNYKLLKNTIEITGSRLFVNWGTIFPIKFIDNDYFVNNIFNNYSYYFIKDNYFINNDELTIINYNINNDNSINLLDLNPINYKHLSLYTIHNSIHYYYNKKNNKEDITKIINIFNNKINNNDLNKNKKNEIFEIIQHIINDKIYEQKTYQEINNYYNDVKIKENMNYIIMISLYLLSINGTLNVFEYKYNNINDMIENIKSPLTEEELKEYDNNIYFLTKKTYKELDEIEDKAIEHNILDKEEKGYNNNTRKKDIIKKLKKIEKLEKIGKIDNTIEINEYKKLLKKEKLTDKEKENMKIEHVRDKKKYIPYHGYYSLMWVSQLKFYYKFINCRVIYLTGGTGVGKSTQIPKLLLYGINTFDFNINGKLINTQPRQKPTSSNAIWIGRQMGIYIEDFNANPYIQFQHGDQDTSSVNKDEEYFDLNLNKRYDGKGLLFKVCTDKLLFNDLLKYPIYTNNLSNNIYDCIMIDETHEHNVNMDLILSILKPIIMLNNTLRLIIVSATMDNDEPYYRRFYKDVLDNQKYPNRCNDLNIDRFYLDRRVHISEPGKDTTYKITEYYEDKFINNEEERNIKIKDILLKILSKNDTKDILVFKAGSKEIKDCINYLNKYLPDNVYCLPYLSSSNYHNQDIPVFLDKYNDKGPQSIHISKDINILEEENDNLTDITKGNNNYNHIVFIGTNVIEASVTIDRLTHIIDDGQQKVMIYDYNTKISQLTLMNIAEMNRKQRKGRVGRKADGTVYYLYPEHYLEKEKLQYKICNENIDTYMYDLIIDNNSNLLLTNNNTNLNKYLLNKYSLENLTELRKNNFLKDNLYTHNFNYKYLYDPYFKNLIIHPLENEIERNILGNIINKDNIYINNYKDLYYPIFNKYTFEELINNYLSLNLIIDKHDLNNNDNYIKSLFAKKLSSIFQNYKDPNIIQFSLMLVLGKKLNIYEDILFIIFLLLNRNEEKLKKHLEKKLDNRSDIYNLYLIYRNSNDLDFGYYSSNFKIFKYDINYNLIIQLSNFIFDLKEIQNLNFYDKLSFILLICFNNNIFKKIPNSINKGINLFIPNNILTLDKNVLSNQNINNNIIYIDCIKRTKNDISSTTISWLNSFDKIFLKYISNIIIFNYEKIKYNIKQINHIDNDINLENYKLTLNYLLSLLRLIKYYHYDIYNNIKDLKINEIDCEDLDEPENYKHLLFKSFCEEKRFELFISNYIFKPIISNEHIIYYNFNQNENGYYLILNYLNKNNHIFIDNLYLNNSNKTINKQIKDLTDNDIKNIYDCYNSNDTEKFIDLNMILNNNIKHNNVNLFYLSCHTFKPEFNYYSTLHIKNGNYEKDLKDNKKYFALIYNNNSLELNFNSNLINAFTQTEYNNLTDDIKFIINNLKDTFNNCYLDFLNSL